MLKKITITLLAVGCLFLVIRFTPVGFVVASICGVEYYSEWDYERLGIDIEGSMPPAFGIVLGGSPPKTAMPIPGFLFYSRDQHKIIIANLRIPRKYTAAQYIDLTKLQLELEGGRREDLLPPSGSSSALMNTPVAIGTIQSGNISTT